MYPTISITNQSLMLKERKYKWKQCACILVLNKTIVNQLWMLTEMRLQVETMLTS